MLISTDKKYDLNPGDHLKILGDHMSFNCKYRSFQAVAPIDIVIVKEYDRFFLIEAVFSSGLHEYECMNKAALYEGNCYYKKI